MLLDPRHYRLDAILQRPYTPSTPFGASGNCLWAASPQGWGWSEGVHWLHPTKTGGYGPIQLAIEADGLPVEPSDALYRPSHVTLHGRGEDNGLQVTEDKFITADDVVVSVLSLRNPGDSMIALHIDLAWGLTGGAHELRRGIPVYVHREGPPGDDLTQRLPPGARRTLVFAVAFSPHSTDEARRRAAAWAGQGDATAQQAADYQAWFDTNIPRFDCSDPWLTKLWYHRWYLLKKNHSNPGVGLLPLDTFSEGRWGSEWYSATITYGAGHVLREARWLRDSRYAQNYFRGFAQNQRGDGLYRSFYVDGIARPDSDEGKYADWVTAGVWQTHLVHPDTAFLREALPALQKNIAYWQTHDRDGDGLLHVDSHWWTGMEWQPSFFVQADFHLGERRDGTDLQNPVKRLDLTSYQYANLQAIAQIARTVGDSQIATEAEALATRLREAVRAKMWNGATQFFYDLLPGSDALLTDAKTVAAFYPFYAGLAGADEAGAWRHLLDAGKFWTAFPPASASMDCPAYAQDKTMRGKPLTGCVWNGPTWPHAGSLVITGLAQSLQTGGEASHPAGARQALWEMVNSFGRAQFERGDFDRPHTGEFYRGDTGVWQTGERDYLHSTWADLILTAVVGLVPRPDDTLEISPLMPEIKEGGWSYFCVEDVPYRGRLLTIVWDDPQTADDAYGDGDKGFTVYVDGKRHYHQDGMTPFTTPLPY